MQQKSAERTDADAFRDVKGRAASLSEDYIYICAEVTEPRLDAEYFRIPFARPSLSRIRCQRSADVPAAAVANVSQHAAGACDVTPICNGHRMRKGFIFRVYSEFICSCFLDYFSSPIASVVLSLFVAVQLLVLPVGTSNVTSCS